MTLEEMKGQIREKLLAARDIADRSEKDNRDMTGEERVQVQALMKEAGDLRKSFQSREQDDELRKSLADLSGVGLMEPGTKDKRTPSGLIEADLSKKSMGQYFVESAVWNHFQQQNPNGRIGEKTRVQTDALGFKNMIQPKGRGAKALVTGASDTSAGAYIQDQWLGPISGLELFQRPLTIRDLVTNGTTGSDTVEYARVTAITNNAAPVAEATSAALPTQDGSTGPLINNAGGGYKPESAFTTERETAVVKTIAHWIPATKRALSDASQIMTLIDNFLEYGLEEELEDQMISGSGSGENFEGIGTVSGTQSQAWDTDLFTTTRKAKTKVRVIGRARPNGYALNPADVERLDLLQDNEGRYYFGGPGNAGTSADSGLWGLPVIESEAVPAGVGYVGDWTKAILWNRQQASISITDSHADFFVRNLVAILAEMRAAFGVIQPSAFVEIDLTA